MNQLCSSATFTLIFHHYCAVVFQVSLFLSFIDCAAVPHTPESEAVNKCLTKDCMKTGEQIVDACSLVLYYFLHDSQQIGFVVTIRKELLMENKKNCKWKIKSETALFSLHKIYKIEKNGDHGE